MNDRLQSLLAELLDLPLEEVRPQMQRAETDAWDSLSHLRLITAIESEFGTRFGMDEIAELQTPAQIQRIIDSRSPAATGH